MSGAPIELWRRRLHETFRLTDAPAEGGADPIRCRARLRRAQQLRETARRRDVMFGAEMFAEPAFDLLLDLYLGEHGVPADRSAPGSSWRYFAAMEDRGLIERAPDGDDPRCARLRLTAEATAAMEQFLDGT